jgi:hypothetical protein
MRRLPTRKSDELAGNQCLKCAYLSELYDRTPKSEKDYWLMTEIFVMLHDGDICKTGFNSEEGNMTDKERAEFAEKWSGNLTEFITEIDRIPYDAKRKFIKSMLLEYNKLNGDRLARLKEFVKDQIALKVREEKKAIVPGYIWRLKEAEGMCGEILAEISRLEGEK